MRNSEYERTDRMPTPPPSGLYLVVWPRNNSRKCKYTLREMTACLNHTISMLPEGYRPILRRTGPSIFGKFLTIHQPINETFDLNTLLTIRRTFETDLKRFHIHTPYLVSMRSDSIAYNWSMPTGKPEEEL